MVEITRPDFECPSSECPPADLSGQKQPNKAPDLRLGQPVVIGLDVSLVGTGMVAVPFDWGRDWSRVSHATVGYSLPTSAGDRERIDRLVRLGAAAVSFAQAHSGTLAAVESFAFGKSTAAHALGEAAGVIKVALRAVGIDVRTAPMSTARKLLLGHLPRDGVKHAIRGYLVASGAPFRTLDECDAFVAANWALDWLGGVVIGRAPPRRDGVDRG